MSPFWGARAWTDTAGRTLPTNLVRRILAIHNTNKRRDYFDRHRRRLEKRTQGWWAPRWTRWNMPRLVQSHASSVQTATAGRGVYYMLSATRAGFVAEIWAKRWIWSAERLIVRREAF